MSDLSRFALPAAYNTVTLVWSKGFSHAAVGKSWLMFAHSHTVTHFAHLLFNIGWLPSQSAAN
jgi:hypothetical protein